MSRAAEHDWLAERFEASGAGPPPRHDISKRAMVPTARKMVGNVASAGARPARQQHGPDQETPSGFVTRTPPATC